MDLAYDELLQLPEDALKQATVRQLESQESLMELVRASKEWSNLHNPQLLDCHGRLPTETALKTIRLFNLLDTSEGIDNLNEVKRLTGINLINEVVIAKVVADYTYRQIHSSNPYFASTSPTMTTPMNTLKSRGTYALHAGFALLGILLARYLSQAYPNDFILNGIAAILNIVFAIVLLASLYKVLRYKKYIIDALNNSRSKETT